MPTIRDLIRQEAQRQGVDPAVALAVAQQESGLRQDRTSPRGARGVMQLMPATAAELGVNPESPKENIRGGVRYLKQMGEQFGGDLVKQLAAYNAGPGAVRKYGGVPPYKETRGYVTKILGMLGPRSAMAAERPAGRDFSAELFGAPAPDTVPVGRDFSAELFEAPSPAAPAATPAATIAAAQRLPGVPDARDAAWQQAQRLLEHEDALLKPKGFDPLGAAGLAINMALPGVGGALGKAAAPYLGKAAPVLGELAGSYLARRTNVAIGAEPEGALGDVASVAVPGAVRGYQALKPTLARRLPGAGAALHQGAADELAGLAPRPDGAATRSAQQMIEDLAPTAPAAPKAQALLTTLTAVPGEAQTRVADVVTRLRPSVAPGVLYAPLATDATPIRPSAIWKGANQVIKEERRLQPAFRNPEVLRAAEDLQRLIRDGKGAIPLNRLMEHEQRLGLLVDEAASKQWPQERALRLLYKSFLEDTEHAAAQGVPGATRLLAAAAVARKHHALDTIERMLTPGSPGVTTNALGDVYLPLGTQLERMLARKGQDPVFRGSFTPDEWRGLQDTIKQVQRDNALQAFAARLGPGQPGMVTDAATGAVTIGDIRPLRTAFERELAENPTFRTTIPGADVKQLRDYFHQAEQDQAVQAFVRRVTPGMPGSVTDPITGVPHLAAIRPIRLAFEKELDGNVSFRNAVGDRAAVLRRQFHAAEREQAQAGLATMFTPGSPGILTRPDGLVQLHGGKLRDTFEKRLAQDAVFRESLPPEQVTEIRQVLRAIEDLPRIPPPRGQQYGSGMSLARGGLAYSATYALTQSHAAAGLAAAAASATPHYIASALMTEPGRAWLLRTLATDGGLSPATLGLLSGGGRQGLEQGMAVEHQPFPQQQGQ